MANRDRSATQSPIGRILQNTAWLLGGKGFGAICGIAYLAILTRTLGVKNFGHFSLIFGTAQAIIAIAGFQTWRAVVRYGSEHVHAKDWDKLGRLGLLCGVLDAAGAVFGCGLAAILIYGFAHKLDLNPAYIDLAFYFCCASLWALVSAPTGIVRALHRFDMAVYVEAVVPLGRLLAALIIWATGPSVGRFLFAWALVDIIEAVFYWIMAHRLCPQAVRRENFGKWRQAFAENEGIGQFFLVTYASTTLDAGMRNGPLLAVGAFVSTRAAGIYRLATQLTQSLSKLSTLLTRSVYAEVSRMRVVSDAAEFRKLAFQTSVIAGLAGVVVVAIAFFAGKQLLALIGGDDFEQGAAILVPLAIAASFELASVAFEPVLHSTGRARLALFARVIAISALGASIYALRDMGTIGIAWAVSIGGATGYVALGIAALRALNRREVEEAAALPRELLEDDPRQAD